MDGIPKQTFSKKTDRWATDDKVFNIANYQRNAKQNYNDVSPNTGQNDDHQKIIPITNAGEHVDKRELSCTFGGNVNWYSHYGEQYGGFLKKLKIQLPYAPAVSLLGNSQIKP